MEGILISSGFSELFKHLNTLFTPFFVTYAVVVSLIPRAKQVGLIDSPDGIRKFHKRPTPVIGGVCMLAGLLVPVLLFPSLHDFAGLFLAMLLAAGVGFFDDRFGLNYVSRVSFQIAAVVLMVLLDGESLRSFGNLFGSGTILTCGFSVPVTIFCAVGVMNAMNMIDGLDGLAGGIAMAAFAAFGVLAWLNDMPLLVMLSLYFCGTLAAFLRFNWFPSKIFMGDAGSMMLGLVLAWFALALSQHRGSSVSPVAVLLVLALPVTDTITVMIRRLLRGKNPFHADRTHLHYILAATGLSQRNVVFLMIFMTLVSSSVAIAGTILKWSDTQLFSFYMAGFALYVSGIFRLQTLLTNIIRLREMTFMRVFYRKWFS